MPHPGRMCASVINPFSPLWAAGQVKITLSRVRKPLIAGVLTRDDGRCESGGAWCIPAPEPCGLSSDARQQHGWDIHALRNGGGRGAGAYHQSRQHARSAVTPEGKAAAPWCVWIRATTAEETTGIR